MKFVTMEQVYIHTFDMKYSEAGVKLSDIVRVQWMIGPEKVLIL